MPLIKSILTIFFLSLQLFAADLPEHCNANDVVQIVRPLSSSASFIFRYRVVRFAVGLNPTVIVIPGGPGQASMGGDSMVDSIPSNWGVILTDPRGAGCNSSPGVELPYEAFSSLQIAEDINAIIGSLPTENIFLYGTSFGTVVASLVADFRSARGQPPLSGLVLEGTVGRSFLSQEYELQFVSQWELYRNIRLKPESKDFLEQNNWPFSIDRSAFATFINANLIVGGYQRGHQLDIPMQMLATPEGREFLEKNILVPQHPTSLPPIALINAKKLWAKIWCEELTMDGDRWQNTLVGSEMTIINATGDIANRCRGLSFKKGYDSGKLHIREKIIYFQGENDPATSLPQALYHFNSNNSSNGKLFILFPEMGHAPLRTVINFGTNGPDIWRALYQGGSISSLIEKGGFNVQETKKSP